MLEPGHVLGTVGPDVLPFHRLHYSVHRCWSPVIEYSEDRSPTMESDQCIAVHHDASGSERRFRGYALYESTFYLLTYLLTS